MVKEKSIMKKKAKKLSDRFIKLHEKFHKGDKYPSSELLKEINHLYLIKIEKFSKIRKNTAKDCLELLMKIGIEE